MRRIEIPRDYYVKQLKASSATDAIEVEVEAPANGARGLARLMLWPQSKGLTNIEASVSAPRCIIGAPWASPRPPDLTASLPGTRGRCAWRHRICRKGEPVTYEVPFTNGDPTSILRFEFRLSADELERPVVLHIDLQTTETQAGGVEVPAVKATAPVEAESQAGSS